MILSIPEDIPMSHGAFLEMRSSDFKNVHLDELRLYAEKLFKNIESTGRFMPSPAVYSSLVGGGGWQFIASPNIFEQWVETSSILIVRVDDSMTRWRSSGGHGLVGKGGCPYFDTQRTTIGLAHFLAVTKFSGIETFKLEHRILFNHILEMKYYGLLATCPNEGERAIVNIANRSDTRLSLTIDLSVDLTECVSKVLLNILRSIGVEVDLRAVHAYCHEIACSLMSDDTVPYRDGGTSQIED